CSTVYVTKSGEPARADYLGKGLAWRADGRCNFRRTSPAKSRARRGDVRRRSDLGRCLSTCTKHLCTRYLALAHDLDCGLNSSGVNSPSFADWLQVLRFKLGKQANPLEFGQF